MSATLVAQRVSNATYSTNTITNITTAGSTITSITAGNALYLIIKTSSTTSVSSITDTPGNNWFNLVVSDNTGPGIEIWGAFIGTAYSSGNVIAVTLSGGTHQLTNIAGVEVSGSNATGNVTLGNTVIQATGNV